MRVYREITLQIKKCSLFSKNWIVFINELLGGGGLGQSEELHKEPQGVQIHLPGNVRGL